VRAGAAEQVADGLCGLAAGLVEVVAVAVEGERDRCVAQPAADGQRVDACVDEVGDVAVSELLVAPSPSWSPAPPHFR
jgi:hypothetical protein